MMYPTFARRSQWLPEVFNDLFDTDFMPKVNATAPAINVKENEKEYIVELATCAASSAIQSMSRRSSCPRTSTRRRLLPA